jgi:phage shock protein PspC (stress-responsive transcriptional regulator)
MDAGDRFCARCGKPATPQSAPPPPPGAHRRLERAIGQRKIAGVCAGVGRYLGVDTTWVRVAFLIGIFLHGVGLLAYIIGWAAMPRDDERMMNPRPA